VQLEGFTRKLDIAVAAGIVDRETLDAARELLDAHIRLEERQLFPLIEQLVPDDELRRLGLASRETCARRRGRRSRARTEKEREPDREDADQGKRRAFGDEADPRERVQPVGVPHLVSGSIEVCGGSHVLFISTEPGSNPWRMKSVSFASTGLFWRLSVAWALRDFGDHACSGRLRISGSVVPESSSSC
jgi:hypothetical protein